MMSHPQVQIITQAYTGNTFGTTATFAQAEIFHLVNVNVLTPSCWLRLYLRTPTGSCEKNKTTFLLETFAPHPLPLDPSIQNISFPVEYDKIGVSSRTQSTFSIFDTQAPVRNNFLVRQLQRVKMT
jgi:hypothetical protein